MKIQEIKVKWSDWKKVKFSKIKAFVSEEGLAIHKNVYEGIIDPESDWRITHINTGNRFPGFYKTKEDAINCVNELKNIMEWNKITEDQIEQIREKKATLKVYKITDKYGRQI